MTSIARRWTLGAAAMLGLVGPSAAALANGVSFQGLGDLPGSSFHSQASDVSADGRVVVGTAHSEGSISEAFRWTREGGMVGLGGSPGSEAYDVSADGSVVVGASGPGAFRWTAATGSVAIAMTSPFGVSGNGDVVVGWRPPFPGSGNAQAVRWTEATGVVPLGTGPLATSSDAWAISEDGLVAVGSVHNPSGLGYPQAHLWGPAGRRFLGDLAGGSPYSIALGVSSDGSVAVGQAEGASGFEAFRWTSAGGMVGLGHLSGGSFGSASAVSGDGSVVVGYDRVAGVGQVAFIWDPVHGMRDLHQVLTDLGIDLTGWGLAEATGISSDGRTIVGYGASPNGQREAWIAFLPEPGASLLVLTGLLGLAARRQLRRRSSASAGAPRASSASDGSGTRS
jgi:probable HAF family extracellular repeat protein